MDKNSLFIYCLSFVTDKLLSIELTQIDVDQEQLERTTPIDETFRYVNNEQLSVKGSVVALNMEKAINLLFVHYCD